MKPVKACRIFRLICYLYRLQNVQNVRYIPSELLCKITGCRTQLSMICTHFQMLLAPLYQQKWRLEVGAASILLVNCRGPVERPCESGFYNVWGVFEFGGKILSPLKRIRSVSKFYVVGSCHHSMALPQVADRGTASDMEGSCE